MPAEESKLESFDESVSAIAEKVRVERVEESAAEQAESGTEQQREAELEKIRNELRESYGDTGGSGSNDDDSDDDDEEEFDSAAELEPAGTEGAQGEASYLATVPEKYQEPVTELVQSAVQGGIVRATAKAQKKNDPYLVDVFHDSLAQLLHRRMQDQGLL